MRNPDAWRPSKYVREKGRLRASRNPADVGVSSRLIVDLVAAWYEVNLKAHARGRLLDLGCGKVPLFAEYRDLVTENVCVDWAKSHGSTYLDLEHDLNEKLPFDSGAFDTIILSDVLEHTPEPQALCQEMARVLSPGGKLLLNVPFFYWIHEAPYDFCRYTEFALRRFMEKSGLRLLQIESIGGVPEVLADIFGKSAAEYVPLVGAGLASFTQWTAAGFIRTPLGRKMSNATRQTFPLGICLVAEKV